jgi:uncharacterized protein
MHQFNPSFNSAPQPSASTSAQALSVQFLQRQAAALLLYQSVLRGAVSEAFLTLLSALRQEDRDGTICLAAYGNWFQALVGVGLSWQDYLILQLLRADNLFTQQVQRYAFDSLPAALVAAARQDLRSLHQLYTWNGKQLSCWVQEQSGWETLPVVWESWDSGLAPSVQLLRQQAIWSRLQQAVDWSDLLPELAAFYQQFGSGEFATFWAFRWQADRLVGVSHPDPIRLDELVAYEAQKAALQQNTEALLVGRPALHVLLYGSRGTGKSSLVKALLGAYAAQGLRLIEVSKLELQNLPTIVDRVRDLPQKFIIFVDDLSFEEDDDAYKALKVVLEGNITARPRNLVVYATSNRRHLIREFFADRPRPRDSDEIHHWDTMQEKLSFSDRFGLTLTFEPPNQDSYLEIVRHLAEQAGIQLESDKLTFEALQWATRHNGRSGRTARQFVDFLAQGLA